MGSVAMILPQVWPLICLLPVRADLVPGDQIEFKTKAGYKFTGTEADKVSVDIGDDSASQTLCSHRCLLDDTCTAFFMNGSSCTMVTTLTNNIVKDGVTNNIFVKGVAAAIPTVQPVTTTTTTSTPCSKQLVRSGGCKDNVVISG